jgi:hypothetical protein
MQSYMLLTSMALHNHSSTAQVHTSQLTQLHKYLVLTLLLTLLRLSLLAGLHLLLQQQQLQATQY